MGNVLLLDHETHLAGVCGASLSLAGYEVTAAHDLAVALKILSTTKPFDLLITDLRMPRLDGFTVLRWIMSHRPNTDMIVMTALRSPTVTDTAKRLGAHHCLNRPVSRDRLLETVASVLGEPGFLAIISWEEGQINEKKLSAPLMPNVYTGGQSLLLEALRLKDETRRARQPEAGLLAESLSHMQASLRAAMERLRPRRT